MLEPTGEDRQLAEQSEMGQMLAPMVDTYYQRQVTPAFLGAMDATEVVVNRLHPHGHDRTILERQLREMGEKLKAAQTLSAMGLQMGSDFNQPTRWPSTAWPLRCSASQTAPRQLLASRP